MYVFFVGEKVDWMTRPHNGMFYKGTVVLIYTNRHGSTRIQVKADKRKGEYSGHKTLRPYELTPR